MTAFGLAPRKAALEVLIDAEARGSFLHLALPAALARTDLDARDKGLATELVYGVTRNRLALDWLIENFSGRPVGKIDRRPLFLIRLGLYQLLFLDKIPAHAAVDTTVRLAQATARPGSDKFVNAVLRRADRERSALPWPDRNLEPELFLSVYYSHPQWLVNLWLSELGRTETEELLAADNARAKVTLRCNTLKTTPGDLAAKLAEMSIKNRPGKYFPEALLVEENRVPESIFEQGLAYAQDEASIAVGRAAAPIPGATVIDLCAGPGGKTTHLAQLMANRGRIISVDINESRLNLAKDNCRRLGAGIVKFRLGDAAKPLNLPPADRVLVDAPCSGLGVLRRRPDLRWRKQPEDIQTLADLQFKILKQAADYVAPAGLLTYSVCTITRAETLEVVDRFIDQVPGFKRVPVGVEADLATPPRNRFAAGRDPLSLQFLPHKHDTDGMFIAQFKQTGR